LLALLNVVPNWHSWSVTGMTLTLAAKRSGKSHIAARSLAKRRRYVIGLAVAGLQALKQIKCIGCRGN